MKLTATFILATSLLGASQVGWAQCPAATATALSCTAPAGAAALPVDNGGNASVSSGTYYYTGTASINLNLSGGTLYYNSPSATSNVSMSGGTLVYTAGSSQTPGALNNFNQNGGTLQVCGSARLTGNLNGGTVLVLAGGSLVFPNTYAVQNSARFINNGTASFQNDLSIASSAPGMFVNGGTLNVTNTLFLNGPGLVNQGSATVGTLVVNGSGAACLAPNSRLAATTFQTNDRTNSFDVQPATGAQACVSLTNGNSNGFNGVLTASAKLTICKTGPVTTQERAKYGAAQVNTNCSGCQAVPLPVVLVSFAAAAPSAPGGPVQLRWRTASEVGHRGFVVERSAEGQAFAGQSELLPGTGGQLLGRDYAWADAAPLPGTSYYRLRLVAADGTAEYSPTAAVHVAATEAWAWAYPPDADHLRLDWLVPAPPAADLSWQLLDMQGRTVRQQRLGAGAGTTTLELAGLAPGAYWLRVQQGERRQLLRFGRL